MTKIPLHPEPTEYPLLSHVEARERVLQVGRFLAPNEPGIGIDCGDYFVFTLFPSQPREEAFLQGWAVLKTDGQVFQWEPETGAQ